MSAIKVAATERRTAPFGDDVFALIAARFKAMSEPMRLKILHALIEGEMTVSQLVGKTAAGQANISKHLGKLLEAGMVGRRKDGLCVYYSIADESIIEHCEKICLSLGRHFAERQHAIELFTASRHSGSK
jgi:DNA-binding transcriptional ArsR family regulator